MIIQLKNSMPASAIASWQPKLRELLRQGSLTLAGLAIFVLCWAALAANLQTSLGQFPGPTAVAVQLKALVAEHQAEKSREQLFYQRQQERLEKNPEAVSRPYSGRPTFFSQIQTSPQTVLSGFLLASLFAIPAGVLIGLSPLCYSASNPLIQLLKPISPLAWLPLITIVVSASYPADGLLSRSYLVSALTVALCSLWPTLINTIVGVSQVPTDLQNVSKVLRLNWFRHVRAIVLPSAVPMMFTGLRLSLGIAWMVLIAAEMLAQNPGLGKFVWDEFQNGSSDSLARICVAVAVIGLIGLLLDRLMLSLQKAVSWDKSVQLR